MEGFNISRLTVFRSVDCVSLLARSVSSVSEVDPILCSFMWFGFTWKFIFTCHWQAESVGCGSKFDIIFLGGGARWFPMKLREVQPDYNQTTTLRGMLLIHKV